VQGGVRLLQTSTRYDSTETVLGTGMCCQEEFDPYWSMAGFWTKSILLCFTSEPGVFIATFSNCLQRWAGIATG